MLTKNSSNKEVQEVFADQIATGQVVVFAIDAPVEGKDGKMYQQLWCIQDSPAPTSLNRKAAGKLNAMLLDWGNDNFARCSRNALAENVKAHGIEAGYAFDKGINIQITESTTPFYAEQTPQTAGKDGDVLNHNGQPIYRNGELVEDFVGHALLAIDKVQVEANVETEKNLQTAE